MDIRKLSGQDDLIIREVVLSAAQQQNQIIHGTHDITVQLPSNIRRETKDFDVYTENPRKSARELASNLKRRLGDKFKVVKGSHPGTFKVKKNGETVADFTQKRGPIKTKKIQGVRYKKLSTIKKGTQKLVKKKGTEFRREKDIDTLQRIREVERIDKLFDSF